MTLILGMLLDAVLGEPRWLWSRLPHPAILMGQLVGWFDRHYNSGQHRRLSGVLAMLVLCALAGASGWVLHMLPGQIVDIVILAILLAQKSLVQHVQAVSDALRLSLGDGRRAVAMIVGRDTRDQDAPAVARAAIESAAENMSDGVIAPIFWFAVAGLPGLLIYKITNTADSMIGYKTPRHKAFGWAAARLDDLLNLIPARLTALLIWLVTNRPDARAIIAEAPLHRSPNAGWPEAAMAHGLNVALSGPRCYAGQIMDYPFVNDEGERTLEPDHIDQAVQVLWRTWALALLGFGAIALL
ncbi:adenosylcobinamide-phosphate synthase CbiB [Yoonia sediminilitoris]|uniref:Cobalamin biosynthesis protein CobD n=1 Tax=Yoonia sediminilitoris TaxID=1286148 RepID=A0A2T6KFU2_9RHOB|nr:adenosylcobinamide-phosphate synthase CbiB [Yoonia sediminilitoris]PUB14164.1 adenosylcobinamide-phosphate synthase [Yoonia sediminilitoris]RCW95095.1 adenosylcobinamide-phosphate synthase [Yoonia sediminilitoris]